MATKEPAMAMQDFDCEELNRDDSGALEVRLHRGYGPLTDCELA
jgi:hypothetical protein